MVSLCVQLQYINIIVYIVLNYCLACALSENFVSFRHLIFLLKIFYSIVKIYLMYQIFALIVIIPGNNNNNNNNNNNIEKTTRK